MDACVAPILDKDILNYIPPDRTKFVKQRDRDLALLQRAMLNAAAPLRSLHYLLESSEVNIPNNELLYVPHSSHYACLVLLTISQRLFVVRKF